MKELDLGKLEKDQDFNFLLDTWCPGALRSSEWKLGRAEGLQEWTLSVQPLLSKLSLLHRPLLCSMRLRLSCGFLNEFLYILLLVYGLCYSRNFPSKFCFPSVLLVILHWVPAISLGECEPMFTGHWANPLS